MEKSLSLTICLWTAIAAAPLRAFAVEAIPIPAPTQWEENGRSATQLLSDTGLQVRPWIDSEFFLSQSEMRTFRNSYESALMQREYRMNFGLLDQQEAEANQNRLSNLTHEIVDAARKRKWEEERGRVERRLGLQEFARRVPVVVGALALTNSFYFGDTNNAMDLRLLPELRLWAWHNAEKAMGQLIVDTPIVSTSVDYQGSALAKRSADSNSRDELLSFGVTRELPVLQLTTGLKYGLLNRSLNASLSRQILPNLTGSVSAARQVDQGTAYDPSLNSQSAQIEYKLTF